MIGQDEPQIASVLQAIDLKCVFCKTASLQSYRICVEVTSAPVCHLLALAATQAYIESRDVALDHMVIVASTGIVFACHHNIAHVRILLEVVLELHVVFVRSKEGMSSAQCSMHLKKVAEGLAL